MNVTDTKPGGFNNERSSGSTTMKRYQQKWHIAFGNGIIVNFELGVPGFHSFVSSYEILRRYLG